MSSEDFISAEAKEALEHFAQAANRLGIEFILVGARARQFLLDWTDAGSPGRATTDWDFGVLVSSWHEYDTLIEALTGPKGAFSRSPIEHRVIHNNGTRLDLVPFGGIEADRGAITWPKSLKSMTVLGFSETLSLSVKRTVGSVELRMASVAALLLLKLISYADRAESRDLEDIVFILGHRASVAESRMFDELAEALSLGLLEFSDAAPYLLGRDVGLIADERMSDRLLEILNRIQTPPHAGLPGLISNTLDLAEQQAKLDTYLRLFDAFTRGFSS